MSSIDKTSMHDIHFSSSDKMANYGFIMELRNDTVSTDIYTCKYVDFRYNCGTMIYLQTILAKLDQRVMINITL